MVRLLFALAFLVLAALPARAFECVATPEILEQLAQIQPPLKIARLDPQLNGSFLKGMREMGNVTSPVPPTEVTGIVLVSAGSAENLVVMLEVGGQVCGAVRLNKNMAIDIIRRGAEV